MPKRVIDFDAMWGSDKIAACAEWAQAEYAWLYGLADASGCFEITNLRVIWGRVAAIRRNLSIERLEQIFQEFQDKGLLFVWEYEGKCYAHWTGSDVPGRLPPPSWRMRLEKFAPPVPKQKLAQYMARFARGRAALAGVGFRGDEAGERLPAGNCGFETSDSRQNRVDNTWAQPPDPVAQATNGHLARGERDEHSAERGLKGRVEAAPAQDLDWSKNKKREMEAKLDLNCVGNCGAGSVPVQTVFSTQLSLNYDPGPPPSEDPASSSLDAHSRESSRVECHQAVSGQRGDSPPRALDPLDPRGMSAREIALQKALRVGQGPVCWPRGVKPEVIERDRLRELARAKAF